MIDTPNPIRILTVNLPVLFHEALSLVLEQQAEATILPQRVTCEMAFSFSAAGRSVSLPPDPISSDLLLLDLDNCPHQHLECLNSLHSEAPAARVLALAGAYNAALFRMVIGQGVHGVILKTDPVATLIEAIRQIHRGQVWLSYEIFSQLIPEFWGAFPSPPSEAGTANIPLLSKREQEVLDSLGEGFKDQQIADRLGISIGTVRSHLTSIHLKTGIRSRAELINYSHRQGQIEASLPAGAVEFGNRIGEDTRRKTPGATLYVAHRKLA